MKSLRIFAHAVAALLLLSWGAAFAGKPVPISACGTEITEPGKYFVTQDLFCAPSEQGIVVSASDVTVDLKGHAITCDAVGTEFDLVGAVLVGDYGDPTFVLENVWVKNGTVSGCDDGVIFFYTGSGKISKITATNSVAGGITLVEASNTLITKNTGTDNFGFIRTFGGSNNLIKGNSSFRSEDTGILLEGDTGSTVRCNSSDWDSFGIALGPFSDGNLIIGNSVSNTLAGITMYGWGTLDTLYEPGPSGNTIKNNLVQSSWFADLFEILFTWPDFEPIVPEYLVCQNVWQNNEYVSWMGPENCVAPPVVLDDDDVCALDDDSDSD